MSTSVRARILVLLSALLGSTVLPPSGARAGPEEAGVELDRAVLVTTDEDTVLVMRAVDFWTGLPLRDAHVKLFDEAIHPIPGLGKPVARGQADADGWIRISRTPEMEKYPGSWAYVFAPGYGPDARFEHYHGEIVEMREPRDVPLAFRDPLGRPVEGLGIGFLLGCGHTPDVRITQTDAEGRALLRGIQVENFGQVWIWKAGVLSEYGPRHDWRPGEAPRRFRCKRAAPVVGRILTAGGAPAVGVAVGVSNYHRGPWALTDARGRFEVLGSGAVPGGDLVVETLEGRVGETHRGPTLNFVVPPPGFERVLRLPPEGEDATAEDETATIHVEVQIEGTLPEQVAPDRLVCRKRDGLTRVVEADGRVEVPPGTYVVFALLDSEGSGWPGLAQARTEVTVAAGGTARVTLSLPQPRVLDLNATAWPEDARVVVVTETLEYGASADPEGGTVRVYVPTTGTVYLRLEQGGHERLVRVPDVALARTAKPFVLPWIKPTTIRAHFVNPDGSEGVGFMEIAELAWGRNTSDEPRHEVEALVLPGEGLSAYLAGTPEGYALQQVRLPSPLPEGGVIDLGAITLAPVPAPRILIVGLGGTPEGNTRVRISHGAHRFEATTDEMGFLKEERGPTPAVAEGALVLVIGSGRGPALIPWRTTLEGSGPWRLEPPKGQLRVTVSTTSGDTLRGCTVLVDGIPLAYRDAPRNIRALELGPHEVVITAPDHRAWRYRIVLENGEPHEIRCRLRKTAKALKTERQDDD